MKKSLVLLGIFALFLPLVFLGCEGDDGAQGPAGPPGPPGAGGVGTATVNPESCAICHDDENVRDGDAHQADYDQRFQDNVVTVVPGTIEYTFNAGDNTHTVTFQMTETVNGVVQDFNCEETATETPEDSLGIYFAEYNPVTGTFDPPAPLPTPRTSRLSLGSQGNPNSVPPTPDTLTYLGGGVCESTVNDAFDNVARGDLSIHVGDLSLRDGIIFVYGRDDRQGNLPSPSRVVLAIHPFAGLAGTGAGAANVSDLGYVSAATVSGCEKCHTVPFLKHGYIYARVAGDNTNDFYSCKACHSDNGEGGHFVWQLLVNDPRLIIDLEQQYGGDWEESGDARLDPYAYKTSLMNDVHMSHAMEFAYPQSMGNCVVCHEGKLDTLVLTDNNFVIETCKSCHPVTAPRYADKDYADPHRAPALEDILPAGLAAHAPPFAQACNGCHTTGGIAPVFNAIHTGYDQVIYSGASGTKYSDAITVSIDNASFVDNTNLLSFSVSAAGSLGAADSADIVPTVLVGLYGYTTKDFYIGPHERSIDTARNLEAAAGTTHPRITITSPSAGSWDVTADLTEWAAWIDNGTIMRAEIGVMPRLRNADNVILALNAVSRTFNLTTNAFEDTFFGNAIADPAKCNTCHEALSTTFHSPDRGGSVVVCRMCHITKSPGSHLELQSRSIDSYTHAIHRFQVFDIGDIDFTDPVDALLFEHHVNSNFPRFGIEDCSSCHNPGVFNVPEQTRSMPGALSSADFVPTRDIGTIPRFITGPATRACGACHRAAAIIANDGLGDPAQLAAINSHMSTFGYLVEVQDDPASEVLAITDDLFLILTP